MPSCREDKDPSWCSDNQEPKQFDSPTDDPSDASEGAGSQGESVGEPLMEFKGKFEDYT